MLNVNVSQQEFLELEKHGFILEHEDNMLIIRDMFCNPLSEITYFCKENEILVSTRKEYHWCRRVKNVLTSAKGKKLFIIAEVAKNKTISIEIQV